MIKIFEDMFGAIFWSQAVIVLTHLPMDSWSTESLTNRPMHSCNYEQQPLPVSASEQGCTKTTIFEIVIYNYNRDSHMSLTDTIEEEDAFQKEMQELWKFVEMAPLLNTDDAKKVRCFVSRNLKRNI